MRTSSPEIEERKSYYRSLRRLLSARVRGTVEERHEQPDARILELVQQLDEKKSAS